MSLHLGDIFGQSTRLQTQTAPGAGAAQQTASGGSKAPDSLNLPIGATVSGIVVKAEGDRAVISINGNELQAKMENAVSLEQGANVTFQVSGMADGQVILKSLFQNMAMQATAEKALQQAGITVGANALGMVQAMMENGMAIDKNALQAMYQDVVRYPQLDGADMVSMHQLGLQVDDKNVTQFQSYLNLEHQISAGIGQMTDSLLSAYEELSVSDPQKAFGLMAQLLASLADEMDGEAFVALRGNIGAEEQAAVSDVSENNPQDAAVQKTMAEQPQQMAQNATEVSTGQPMSYLEALQKIALLAQENGSEGQSIGEQQQADIQGNMARLTDANHFQAILRELGISQDAAAQLADGARPAQELFSFLHTVMEQAKMSGDQAMLSKLEALFHNKDFQTLVRNETFRQLLLQPQSVSDKSQVEAYYAKLVEQTDTLLGKLSDFVPQNHQVMQELTNLRDNLDFMNQLNHTMSYVQLPLKLSGGNAHGDLYVYTNKKSLAASDGNVSAYLHLDMDHLGPVDVYVALQGQKVSTNFYLRDDEMIDLVSAHIDQLNERLEQKGYQMQASITKKETPKSEGVMHEIVEDHKGKLLIGSQSFDMRA